MYFLGDTHGVRSAFQVISKHKLENQNIIHVGDFGLGFQDIIRDVADLQKLDELLEVTGNTLYVIRGNHDNPIFWDGKLRLPKFMNIRFQPDYSINFIEGKSILFVGGAISIDRLIRGSEYPPTWWKEERFILDYDKLDELIKLHDLKKLDIVVTHTAPGDCYPYIKNPFPPIVTQFIDLEEKHGLTSLENELKDERYDVSKLRDQLIRLGLAPKHWLYGHFHSTKKEIISGIEFKLVNINELYEVN
jgi:UDP-2,3-diacylglucosamine pyrophosphatase LpxH